VEYCITKYKSLLKNADGTSFNVDDMVSHLMETKEVVSPELEKAQKVCAFVNEDNAPNIIL
jgi:hypothetical protein